MCRLAVSARFAVAALLGGACTSTGEAVEPARTVVAVPASSEGVSFSTTTPSTAATPKQSGPLPPGVLAVPGLELRQAKFRLVVDDLSLEVSIAAAPQPEWDLTHAPDPQYAQVMRRAATELAGKPAQLRVYDIMTQGPAPFLIYQVTNPYVSVSLTAPPGSDDLLEQIRGSVRLEPSAASQTDSHRFGALGVSFAPEHFSEPDRITLLLESGLQLSADRFEGGGSSADEFFDQMCATLRSVGSPELHQQERREWVFDRVPVTVIRYVVYDPTGDRAGWIGSAGPFHDTRVLLEGNAPVGAQGSATRHPLPTTELVGRLTAKLMIIMAPRTRP